MTPSGEAPTARVGVRGKLLVAGESELTVRGVTYGTFRRAADGTALPSPERVSADLGAMTAAGVTAVRTYEPPPAWFLDAAQERGLRVMVGVPWEQHVAFLGERSTGRSIQRRVRDAVRPCAGHPAVLCYAVGNEVPAPIVRWHGRRAVEGFIERLATIAKDEDPGGLVTYVNFPTTEYLRLPFLDLVCFNVYLEAARDLESYLGRLHTIAGDRPLLMAELGVDSRRHGVLEQARALERQLDVTFASGCAGAFVFAWTDEWHRGAFDVKDWDFGLVTRDRRPKPALDAVSRAFRRAADADAAAAAWPRISVVVCTHNGERWLPGCFDALERVRYPDWEVIVVNDGSDDGTDDLVRERGWPLIRSADNVGLSAARNLGWQAATGEIVAYLDDDARPEPAWLRHLARAFLRRPFAAVGGPNLPPPEDGFVASCVAHAPGGPAHVLLSDEVAEHVPGCNMAIRRECLQKIGGFDPCFRIAGDDVDVCWRLQAEGLTVGFSPAAVVWHHRRDSVRAYLRQQFQYGRAEGLLERKWPERYNAPGHLHWAGRIYDRSAAVYTGRRAKVRYGTWGTAAFQSLYPPADGTLGSLLLMPEAPLALAALGAIGLLGLVWPPLLAANGLAGVMTVALIVDAHRRARSLRPTGSRARRIAARALTTALYLMQPVARLAGRLRCGLSPWRRSRRRVLLRPRTLRCTAWSEQWHPLDSWLGTAELRLRADGVGAARGGDFDRWDLHIRGGPFGGARLLCAVEEHGDGRQLARFCITPRCSRVAVWASAAFAALALAAVADNEPFAATCLGALVAIVAATTAYDCGAAMGLMARAVSDPLPAPSALATRPQVRAPARAAALPARAPRRAEDVPAESTLVG